MNTKKICTLLLTLTCSFTSISNTPVWGAQIVIETPGKSALKVVVLTIVSLLKNDKEETFQVEAKSTDTIESLQEKIKLHDIAFSDKFHELSFKNCSLSKNKLLSDYGIENNEKISIINRSKGGADFEIPDFEFSNFENKNEIDFSDKAPPWRTLCRGLNLEGTCSNKICKAYKKKVWVQKGFGTFSMQEEVCESICPICKEEVEGIKECGFFYCNYHIRGRKTNNEKIDFKDAHRKKTGFRKFGADGEESARYKWLKIIVTKHSE